MHPRKARGVRAAALAALIALAVSLPPAPGCAGGSRRDPAPPPAGKPAGPGEEPVAPRGGAPDEAKPVRPSGDGLIHEVRSSFSHIRIRDKGPVRTLSFVRDTGEEVLETSLDLKAPHRLLVPYTQTMFAHLLLAPAPRKVLIVGLGGGAMVRFLNRHFPSTAVDAVEIDPEIVRIASEYFGTRPGPRTRIITEDAFVLLGRAAERYDVIYMDAFLKPCGDTDAVGVPLQLKTVEFLKSLHRSLEEGGMVVFNLNPHEGTGKDLEAIRSAFPQVYEFQVPRRNNLVAVATRAGGRAGREALEAAARDLDRARDAGFSFQDVARQLR